MKRLGVNHQYTVSEYISGEIHNGTLYGNVIVEADDDPLFESLSPLAEALKRKGINRIEGDVLLSLMRDDTLKAHPSAAFWDIPYHKVPILLKGRERVECDFRHALQAHGIEFHSNPTFLPQNLLNDRNSTSYRLALIDYSSKAERIFVHHTPIKEVIAPMLIHSSNIKADALFYHLDHVYDHLTGHYIPEKPAHKFVLHLRLLR